MDGQRAGLRVCWLERTDGSRADRSLEETTEVWRARADSRRTSGRSRPDSCRRRQAWPGAGAGADRGCTATVGAGETRRAGAWGATGWSCWSSRLTLSISPAVHWHCWSGQDDVGRMMLGNDSVTYESRQQLNVQFKGTFSWQQVFQGWNVWTWSRSVLLRQTVLNRIECCCGLAWFLSLEDLRSALSIADMKLSLDR